MRPTIIYALILLMMVSSASAQPPQASDTWRTFSEKLPVGEFIDVRLKTGRHVKGHFLEVAADDLRMTPKTRIPVPVRDIPFGDIESVTRQKEGMSPGAKVLMGVGIGVGAFLALLLLYAAELQPS